MSSSSSSSSSSSLNAMFFLILCANLWYQVENKSIFGIGTRIIGDQLLMKDVLQSPPISLTEEPVIKFNYAIVEPITYIEIVSENNIYAVVNFSYENDLVEGTVSSMNGQQKQQGKVLVNKSEPFEVLIQIYGLNETMLNVNPAYILNKDQQFNGVLKPKYPQDHETLSLMQEDINALDNLDDYDETDDVEGDDENGDYDEEDEFDEDYDKIIEQGERQEGDSLVYEINQTSANTTESLTNHSVTFYYIDIFYITYVKFTLFDHYLYNNRLEDYVPPIVEYGHISPTTLKAIVTDHQTKSLFVQMQMYGYHPNALPVDFKPFLSNGQTAPISSLNKLKLLMNAQPQQPSQQQQHQQNIANEGIQQTPTNELGQQQISPSNDNSNVNCWQQAVSANTGSSSNIRSDVRTYGQMVVFNLIVTMVVTMIFIQNPIY